MNQNSTLQAITQNKGTYLLLLSICCYVLLAGFFDFLPAYDLYNEKRILQIIILQLVCLTGLLSLSGKIYQTIKILPNLAKTSLAIIFMIGLASSITHQNIQYGLLEIGHFLLIFFSIIIIAITYTLERSLFEKLLIITILSVATLNIISASAAFFAAATQTIPLVPHDLFLNFSTVRFFNQIQSWTIALIVLPVIYFSSGKKTYKAILIFIAACWWWLIFISGGRGILLSIFIAAITTAIIYRSEAITWLKWQLISCVSGFAIYYVLTIASGFSHVIQQYSAGRSISSAGRIELWLYAWNLIRIQPILGIGPMNYACTADNGLPAAHPHNSVIQIAVEWGLPAALLMLTVFLFGIYSWAKWSRASNSANTDLQKQINVGLFATLITASIHSLFSGIIVMPHSQMFMILIVGWTIGIYFLPDIIEPRSILAKEILIVRALIILGILFTLFGIWDGLSFHRQENLAEATQLIQEMPRFWQEGKVCP